MAGKAKGGSGPSSSMAGKRLLIIEARFYDDIADALVAGAVAEIEARGASYARVSVPGALEIPQVLAAAIKAGRIGHDPLDDVMDGFDIEDIDDEDERARFDGAVALGCVIRGETSHYDIVCENANHWLMQQAIGNNVPVGNGILTVDTREQAMARAEGGRQGKGGDAARACLRLIEIAAGLEDGSI